jgi:glyoxylate/hydroxypyruvate reductase
MVIFIYTPLSAADKATLRQTADGSNQVIFRDEVSPDQQSELFQSAEVVMGNPPLNWFNDAQQLAFWQLDSAGFDKYSGLKLTIPVANMGDYFAWPCAETIVAGIMALYRRIDELAVLQRQQKWVGVPLRFGMNTLHKQRVVILGSGAIGQAVQRILTGFDCTIQLMARTNPDAQLHTMQELLSALPTTDLVINTLPGSADGFVTAQVLGTMKQGSVYANVGRGNTTDEPALIQLLQNGHLGGAVLDVTVTEPLPTDNPLWTMSNVVLTQHTAGGQRTEDTGKVTQFLRNLERFEKKQPLENQIDLARGY